MAGFFSRSARAIAEDDGTSGNEPLRPIDASDAARRVELLDSFEAAGLGWFWATDAKGRLIYLSENAAHTLGWTHGEAIGKPRYLLRLADVVVFAHKPCAAHGTSRPSDGRLRGEPPQQEWGRVLHDAPPRERTVLAGLRKTCFANFSAKTRAQLRQPKSEKGAAPLRGATP